MNFTFLVEIFPHTHYGVRDVASMLLLLVAGSIGNTLFYAPAAILYHWNTIEPHDEQIHRESTLMSLLFASYENYVQSSKSFQEGWNWMENFNICQKPTKYGQSMFCEAVKVGLENSKETSFKNTITRTLSLITVLFEDLFEAITFYRDFSGEKVRLEPLTSLPNKPIHVMDMTLTLTSSLMRSMHSKKNHCCCLRIFVSLVTGNSTKNCFVFLW